MEENSGEERKNFAKCGKQVSVGMVTTLGAASFYGAALHGLCGKGMFEHQSVHFNLFNVGKVNPIACKNQDKLM